MSIYKEIHDACDHLQKVAELAKDDGTTPFANYIDRVRMTVWNTFVEEYCAGNTSIMYERLEDMLEEEKCSA